VKIQNIEILQESNSAMNELFARAEQTKAYLQ
jgi:hypothetical protein